MGSAPSLVPSHGSRREAEPKAPTGLCLPCSLCQHEQKELLQNYLVCKTKRAEGENAAFLVPELPGERDFSVPGSGDTGKLW